MCLLEEFYIDSVEESESENKKLPSREIRISDECVNDQNSLSITAVTYQVIWTEGDDVD